jgi:citrate lyase subunit beta / citryl-CoA lyase
VTVSAFGYPLESAARQVVRRSALIMPVNVPAFVEKAHLREADSIVLDLEDSIPYHQKAQARRLVREAVAKAGRGGGDVFVRINRPWELGQEDLDASIVPGLAGIAFPKPETVDELERADEEITKLEAARGIPAGTIQISISLETVEGLFNGRALAKASPRLVDISLGSEDFTLDLGIEPTPAGTELLYGKLQVVLLARWAGLHPMGTMRGIADYRDLDGLRESIATAAAVGYRGASCIHPSNVPLLNEGFSPKPEAVFKARRVMEVYAEAEAAGRASVGLDGQMIDIPVVERAQRLVERADRIAAFDARKQAALAVLG